MFDSTMKVCRVRDVKLPNKAHKIDAGFDFFIPNDFTPTVLEPGKDICIPSGVKVIVPHGYALIAKNKSGVATKKKLRTGACVVDEGYTGEVHIHLFNDGEKGVQLLPGEKIVQFILVQIGDHIIQEVTPELYDEMTITYERGTGAFGSTGDA